MWELRVLGEVDLLSDDQQVDIGPARQRAVFAALAVDVGRRVSIEALIDRVWDLEPPRTVRNALHTYVLRLRRALSATGEAADDGPHIDFQAGGYVLRADPDWVDLAQFTRLIQQARDDGGDPHRTIPLLRAAMRLWRGEPLAGLPGSWAAQLRDDLEMQRLSAALALASLELDEGTPPGPVIDALRPLLDRHPLVESLAALLIRALNRDGRQAEALACYHRTRERLAAELGSEPGTELRAAYRALSDGTDGPRVAVASPTLLVVAPAQLPSDVRGFTGRRTEVAALDDILAGADSTTVAIAAISGTAGVGKSTLAVHWAQRVRGRFPDGQLYVNLRGFDPAGPPASPAEALRGFLVALGMAPQRVPADLPAQSALYRSVMAGRRMLVLLDNAADAGQVRPLLPGDPACTVLVTSRDRLSGLVATDGAHPVLLETLSGADARHLLARRIGTHRIRDEPEAVDDIVAACSRLPLALAVAAARAATHPNSGLRTIATQLRDTRERLDPFAGSDPATDVRAVFSWSYRALRPAAARAFRLLGLHPGLDAGLWGIAALLGLAPDEVRPLLAELREANLLDEPVPGRYTCHDLLRAYARELAQRVDSEQDRHAALQRVLDHYLHTALAADRQLYPSRVTIDFGLDEPAPGVILDLPDVPAATAWFTVEYRVLVAAVKLAADAGFDTHAWVLPWALGTFFQRQWYGKDWISCLEIALAVTLRGGDPARQAWIYRALGYAHSNLGSQDASWLHLSTAATIYRDLGSIEEQANTHLLLGITALRQSRHAEGLKQASRAFKLYGIGGNRRMQASALNNMGWCHVALGNYDEALRHCQYAVAIQVEVGNRMGAAHSWDSLGYVHHHVGRYDEAIACYQRSRELFKEAGDQRLEAVVLTHIGDAHQAAGQVGEARQAWRQALDIYTRIDHPDAESLREKLRGTQPTITLVRPRDDSPDGSLTNSGRPA